VVAGNLSSVNWIILSVGFGTISCVCYWEKNRFELNFHIS
jgi:hypothetical protein